MATYRRPDKERILAGVIHEGAENFDRTSNELSKHRFSTLALELPLGLPLVNETGFFVALAVAYEGRANVAAIDDSKARELTTPELIIAGGIELGELSREVARASMNLPPMQITGS